MALMGRGASGRGSGRVLGKVVGRSVGVCVTKISGMGKGGGGWLVLGIQWGGGVLEGKGKSVGRSVGWQWARPASPLFRDGLHGGGWTLGYHTCCVLGCAARTLPINTLLSFVWGRWGCFWFWGAGAGRWLC